MGKGKKGERRRTASAGVTAAAPPCRTDEGERRGGSSLPPPWHPSARVITASFVGSLPPNPFLPPPLESQTGEGEDAGQCREEERDPLHNAAPPCCCRRRAPMVAAGKIQRERSSRKEKDRRRRVLFERPCLHRLSPLQIRHRPPRRTTPRRRRKPPLRPKSVWLYSHRCCLCGYAVVVIAAATVTA